MITNVIGLLFGLGSLLLLASPWPYLAPVIVLGMFGLAMLYQRPDWGLLGIVTLVPFEGLFKGNSLTAAKLVGAALMLVLIFKILLRQIPAERLRSNLWWPLLGFLLWLMLSLAYSEDLSTSMQSVRDLMVGLVLFGATLLLGSQVNLGMLCRLVAIGVASTCLGALVSSRLQEGGRAVGLALDANNFALLITVATPLALLLALHARRWPLRLLWITVSLILVAGLIKTESRSGLLVLLSVCTLGIWHYRLALKRIRPRHLGFVILAGALLVPLGATLVPADYVKRIESLSMLESGARAGDASLGRRSSYLVVGGQMIHDNPLLGSGFGTFAQHFAQSGFAKAFSEGMSAPDLLRHAHNTYLELFSELGIPAGLFFVTLVVLALRNFERARFAWLAKNRQDAADMATHLGLSLLVLAVFLLFLSSPNHKYLWVFLALSSVVRAQAQNLTYREVNPHESP